jgi:hypothetical protein
MPKTVKVRGKEYQILGSSRKGKKYKVMVGDKAVHFGAKGYRMFPGTKRGDSYCARSSGIKGKDNITSPNFWARKLWKCSGKKSIG